MAPITNGLKNANEIRRAFVKNYCKKLTPEQIQWARMKKSIGEPIVDKDILTTRRIVKIVSQTEPEVVQHANNILNIPGYSVSNPNPKVDRMKKVYGYLAQLPTETRAKVEQFNNAVKRTRFVSKDELKNEIAMKKQINQWMKEDTKLGRIQLP